MTDGHVTVLLHRATVEMDYQAVLQLHRIYAGQAPPGELWTWWLNQAEALARSGERSLAAAAIDLSRKANIEPWDPLTAGHYARMRAIEAM
ncbi:hypothetical protein FXF50_04765 [Micromonospora sp. AP08]|uniref:hypothetical protein n=1 Tax=Micromonospora sp. AP08 TaxID=2604467 RepID=UPI0011D50442|nr:hypothetical protein [Micromonospora sp. AP08]TYB39694.1 hypothetical protein FXF50_04765 [Micromonospora sp. AP08]